MTSKRRWPDFYQPQPNPRDTYSYLDESGLDVDWRDVVPERRTQEHKKDTETCSI